MKILCIGDSLTYGYRVTLNERWTYLIGKNLNATIINKGILGDTTAGMLLRFYEDVVLEKPNFVIIMGGTNDFLINSKLENVTNNIKKMVKEANQHNIKVLIGIQPSVIPYMAKKFWDPNVDYPKINMEICKYRKWIINFSNSNNLNYIDFYETLKKNLTNFNKKDFYIDGLHLNSHGHKLMYKAINKNFFV